MNFTITQSEVLFKGKVFDLQVDQIKYKSGNTGVRETAVHKGGAVVVALTKEYKIVFVNQYRYPLHKYLLELPAGKLNENEDPQTCALRELEEETGYSANKISKLGAIASTPGFCTEILHIFLAEELIAGEHNREEGESGMEIHEFSLKEIDEKIRNGEIYDAKTISGIMLAKLRFTNE